MNCFNHPRIAAVGMCVVCQKAICGDCVGQDEPRLACRTCFGQRRIQGFEYRSSMAIGSLPLIHICAGVDPLTLRPLVAKGLLAIGNIALGGVAIGGLACGLITMGGLSLGLLLAFGGVALGVGVSVGGVAVGSAAVGGVAIGVEYAVGGLAFGRAIIDGARCDAAAAEFVRRWFDGRLVPPICR